MKIYVVTANYYWKYPDCGSDCVSTLGIYPCKDIAIDAVIDIIARTASKINSEMEKESETELEDPMLPSYGTHITELKETGRTDISYLNELHDLWGDIQELCIVEHDYNAPIKTLSFQD